MNSPSVRRTLWLCSLALLLSCQGDTSILLRLEGDVPGAQVIKLRVVDGTGALPNTFTFPDGAKPLSLPGTIDFQVPADQRRIGMFVWVQSNSGGVLAHARSFACFKVAANAENKATLTLAPVAAAFSPNIVQDCKCNGDLDMCDPNAVANTGGTGGAGTGGVSGSGGVFGSGGSGGTRTGGSGGTATFDGGVGDTGVAGTGGTGGTSPDAGVVADAAPVVVNAVFSFDNVADWSSTETTLTPDTAVKAQGTASLSFTVANKAYIRSRAFNTAEVPNATAKLGLSVHLEATASSEANIQLWFECQSASVFNSYVQYKPLGGLALGWNQIVFDLPMAVVNALKAPHPDCKFWMEHQAAGQFRYDNMTFL